VADYTKVNLERDVENSAQNFGIDGLEVHFARTPLGMEQHGVTLFRFGPGARTPFGHKHEDQEEVYTVIKGSARIKVEDEIVELEQWDAIHVPGDKMRCIEGGPDGAEILASGGAAGQESSTLEQGWWSD
jgi:mannose-6-phosphate isomerase-like protein (cupin superfamily)